MRRFKFRYFILLILFFILVLNKGNRTLFRRFSEQRKLKTGIVNAQRQNNILQKRIYYLENEPSYVEKIVRSELSVSSEGEVEYRFSVK